MEVDGDAIDPMDLLATEPDVCINETDPLITCNESEVDKAPSEINHNDDIQEIIDVDDESETVSNTVNGLNHEDNSIEGVFQPGQVPDPFTEEETEVYPTIFGAGHQSIQFQRLHCTACNAHLGSAASKQEDRYIHPLLKVLICKSCFDFYGSGDFDKDEDGSEVYCRWCGQGGKLLCCARCPYAFCQRCIRVNKGKKALDAVLQSDDWLCFVCDPKQIIRQRIMCRALYEYVKQQLITWKPINRTDMLDVDNSLCCKSKSVGPKRKSADEDFTVKSDKKVKKKNFCINPLSKKSAKKTGNENVVENTNTWESNPEDEVVCTPDVLIMMDFQEGNESVATNEDVDSEVISVTTNVNGEKTVTTKSKTKKKVKGSASKTDTAHMKKYPALNKLLSKGIQKTNSDILKTLPRIQAGMSYEWFQNTSEATAKVNQNLTSTISSFSNKQQSIQTVEELTKMYNEFQEAMGNSIEQLRDIRKKLRTEFLNALKKLKFASNDTDNTETADLTQEDDVIIIDSAITEPTLPPSNNSVTATNGPSLGRTCGFIKVKPSSALLASSTIVVIQDTVSDHTPSESQTVILDDEVQKDDTEPTNEVPNDTSPPPPTEENIAKVSKNLKKIKSSIPKDFLKRMATVKVVLDKKLGVNASQPHSCKEYIPFKIVKELNDNEIEKPGNEQINGVVNDHTAMVNDV